MYGGWILAIAFGCATVVLFALGMIFFHLDKTIYVYSSYRIGIAYKVFITLSMFFLMLLIIVCITCGVTIITSKEELQLFEETKDMVEDIYENGSDLDNIGITQTIIEKNQWLARVRVSKEIYGVFSQYYYIDADNIEPIMIRGRA